MPPSGWTLFGVPVSEQSWPEWTRFHMVADGEGSVWFLGPWQLIRLDPRTGEATIWDAADDLQFASTGVTLAPAAGAGVWLMDGPRVRLFDGERFAVDVEVPSEIRNVVGGPESDGWVTDAVEVGSELWVTVVDAPPTNDVSTHPGSGGRVARYSGGAWANMSAVEDDIGGFLAVDGDGGVWAGGVVQSIWSGQFQAGTARRWDGQAWSLPGADGPHAPTEAGDVAADPTGGMWFISGADGLRRFDGTAWTAPVPDLSSEMNSWWQPGAGALVVASDGSAWLTGDNMVARVTHNGSVDLYDNGSGLESVAGLAVGAGDAVVISDVPRVRRLDGERFQEIWAGLNGAGIGAVHAVSDNEAWVNAQDTWYQLQQGAWHELGTGSGYCGAVVATDGALWTTAPAESGAGQFARISSDGYRVIGDRPVACGYGASQSPGPDGSVWVLQGDDVIQYWPDGRRESIGRPKSIDPPPDPDEWGAESAERICLHGVDPTGSVWVSEWSEEDDAECWAGTWHRWDGQRWSPADSPDPFTSSQEHVVSGDGIGWLLRYSDGQTEIARYSQGDIVPVATRPRMSSLTAVSGGRACVFEYPDAGSIDTSAIVCYDAGGDIARFDVAGRSASQFSIAPDGSVWLVGPQVARLPQKLPAP